jgi:acetyl esterase/lipase
MDSLPSFGTAIPSILMPTFKAFVPHLLSNKSSIHSIDRHTHTYGSHPRQQLDLYLPQGTDDSKSPILIFLYGGGLTRGDKIMAHLPEGLVYHNLGAFYAKAGLTTIIMDYRRVNDAAAGTGEDAVFPSGGEDIATMLEWLEGYLSKTGEKRDVFLMGNSAGGLHISTFLLARDFLELRRKIVAGEGLVKLRGGILVSVPFHFKQASDARTDMLDRYYGSVKAADELCPYGLLSAVEKRGHVEEEAIPNLLVLLASLDPVDEIGQPNKDFYSLAKELKGEKVDWIDMPGHNHISPPLGLMSGDEKAEQWGKDVVEWIGRIRA